MGLSGRAFQEASRREASFHHLRGLKKMSASREKKLRQEQAAAGMVDPKTAREAAQRKAERKSRALYLTIAIVFVAVAAGLFVWKSGIIQKNITAVTVDGEKYTAADVSFHAYSIYSSYYNS